MSIEEVRALVAERQRYDDWLAALEAKRADTPPRVFDRVHGDYVARRSEVIVQLQAHVDGLATLGAEREARLGELEGRLGAYEEELAEGMLRNLVGEYDDDRWDAVRQDVEAKIATLGDERRELLTEVEDVRALLSSARPAPPAEPPAPAASEALASPATAVLVETPVVVPAVNADAAREPITVSVAAPTPEASPAASADPAVFELPEGLAGGMLVESIDVAVPSEYVVGTRPPTPIGGATVDADDDVLLDIDMQAMVDNPVPQGQSHEDVLADVAALFDTASIAAVPESTKPEGPRAPIDQAELDDALAMFGEATGPANPQFVQSLQGIEPEHDARVDIAIATPQAAAPAAAPSAPNASDPFDDLAFLRSVIDHEGASDATRAGSATAPSNVAPPSAEPQKTLRCTECGTMNLPTEWYCERCGGELAAF